MIKTIKTMSKQEKERYTVPRKVQDVIPVRRIWPDGIFLVGNKFSKTYKFSDINYLVASREDKESMFLTYSELLNSLDSGAVTKITINNRRMNQANFETSILMPMQGDFRDEYRGEYNQMLLDKATGANGIMQEKYITISVVKKDVEEARAYFSRVGADLISHFAALGSKCVELDATERLRILHDFYRQGEESEFVFREKGRSALCHAAQALRIPSVLSRMGCGFAHAEKSMGQLAVRLDAMREELHQAGGHIKNAGLALAGKEPQESKELSADKGVLAKLRSFVLYCGKAFSEMDRDTALTVERINGGRSSVKTELQGLKSAQAGQRRQAASKEQAR